MMKLDQEEQEILAAYESGLLKRAEGAVQTQRRHQEYAAAMVSNDARSKIRLMPKQHLFLSYCRDNAAEVRHLHDQLIAAGEQVWWDQDILPGQDWKLEIRKAMQNAYAVVLCLSAETEARTTSGIYPETLDAINMLREYPPGDIFLIPVRLSSCAIPMFEIDSTRTLDRLQCVDLFPSPNWGPGMQQLLRALQAVPHHP